MARGAVRVEGFREAYHRAVDAGDLVLAHIVRRAIHALGPDDLASLPPRGRR